MIQASGHNVLVPTLTGLGERVNEHSPSVDFRTHVEDIVEVLNDSEASVLVGHSYGGLVVREAADRVPDKVESVVLIDGWAGSDGTSLFDLAPEWFVDGLRTAAIKHDDGTMIPVPAPALVGVTEPEDVAWLQQELVEQPLRTFEQKTQLSGEVDRIPGTAIICQPGGGLPFKELADALGYQVYPIESGHDAMVTAPEALASALIWIDFLQGLTGPDSEDFELGPGAI